VLAANRDEFLSRPTAAMAWWADRPGILAGRDLKEGGTWLGVAADGRLAALTNYRDPSRVMPGAPSRGGIIPGYLESGLPAGRFLEGLRDSAQAYNGFNILVGDPEGLYWFSNRHTGVHRLDSGYFGLSNRLLNTPWHKVKTGTRELRRILESPGEPDHEALFTLLGSREMPPDSELPDTGVGLCMERVLAPIFITSPGYGTRSSTVLVKDDRGRIRVTERTYDGFDEKETFGYEETIFAV
jgi:uncharacterized protein with NRDE domain